MCQATDALRQAAVHEPVESASVVSPATRRAPRRVAAASNRLVLLGTAGGGNPKSTRSGFANAVAVGDVAYIIDCGEGVDYRPDIDGEVVCGVDLDQFALTGRA